MPFSSVMTGRVERPRVSPKPSPSAAAGRVPLSVLAAITDDELAGPILEVARSLTDQRHPTLLHVLGIGMRTPEAAPLAAEMTAALEDSVNRKKQERVIRHRLGIDTGKPANWPLEMAVGEIPDCIAEAARRYRSELILVGLHHHNFLSRLIGNDTIGRLVSVAARPVMAVTETLTTRPQRIVVGVDFTPASMRAAHIAARIVADGGVIYLVFVRGETAGAAFGPAIDRISEMRGIEASFEDLIRAMHARRGVTVMSATVVGNPVEHLERFCSRSGADLLAVGSKRLRLRDRLRIGSVASTLLKYASHSMLIVPPMRTHATNQAS